MGEGAGVGYSVNLPLQPFTDDAVYLPAFEAVVPPLLRAFAPDVTGNPARHRLASDRPAHPPGALPSRASVAPVGRILEMSPRVVALGGGGYDLVNVARAWTAAWAALNGMTLPDPLPATMHHELRSRGLKTLTLSDPPAELPGDARHWAEDYAARQVRIIQEQIFPLHGL